MKILWISLFGVAGVLSRYGMGLSLAWVPSTLPVGTFAINVLGSFLAGMLYVVGMEKSALPEDIRSAALIGFLGGFTTFSAYCLETLRLFEAQLLGQALFYFVASPLCGAIATIGGLWVARTLLP